MKKILVVLCVIGIVALFYGTGAWKQTKVYSTWEEELTITKANGRDSTAVMRCDREVTIAIQPGYSANDDSFAADSDSTKVIIFARGWTDNQRTHCLGNVALWGSANHFQMVVAATPASEDSGSRTIRFGRSASPDSALLAKENWPYIDIVIADTGTNCGKNSVYKIKYIGYSENVVPN